MKSYTELLKKYIYPSQIPYEELLCTTEWILKRDKIVKRDNCECRKCGKEATMYDSVIGTFWLREDHKKDYGWLKEGENSIEKEINWVEYFHEESDRPYSMQVHHSYYILSKLPWEYLDEDLITWCNWCHLEFHKENKVPVYMNDLKIELARVEFCWKCKGTGWFHQYKHVENGVCFECRGKKFSIIN